MSTFTINDRRTFSLWLAVWAALSMTVALLAMIVEPSITSARGRWFTQSMIIEFLVWGLAEVGFAFFGLHAARTAMLNHESDPRRLVRLLRFIIRVDAVILFLAAILIVYAVSISHHASGRPGALLAGHGLGILAQCGFLLLLARYFLRRFSAHLPEASIDRSELGR